MEWAFWIFNFPENDLCGANDLDETYVVPLQKQILLMLLRMGTDVLYSFNIFC